MTVFKDYTKKIIYTIRLFNLMFWIVTDKKLYSTIRFSFDNENVSFVFIGTLNWRSSLYHFKSLGALFCIL